MQPLTFTLHEMIWLMDSIANRLLKSRFNISFSKFYVLAVLSTCEPTSQADLAVCMEQSTAAVSKSLAVLETEGMIKVEEDPAHGRKNVVSLSPKGKGLVTECTAFLEETFLNILSPLDMDLLRFMREVTEIKHKLHAFNEELSTSAN